MLSAQSFINSIIQLSYSILDRQYIDGNNIVFSAYSAHSLMSLLNNGAVGNTEREFTNTLTGKILNKSLKEEINEFHKSNLKRFIKDDRPDETTLSINNFIFYKNGIEMFKDFKKIAKKDFGVYIEKNNFDHGYKEEINEYIKSKTDGKMIKALSEEFLITDLIIINTISFLGKWKIPFDTDLTTNENFYLNNNESVYVDMMYVSENFYYFENKEFTAVKMYYAGKKYFMLFILPKREICINQLLKKISEKNKLKEICSNLKKEKLTVGIPKFKFETTAHLDQDFIVLNKSSENLLLGHELSKIVKTNLQNLSVLQKTYISVDEIQTEAKVVTELSFFIDCIHRFPPSKHVIFKRNFIFFLMHNNGKNNLPLISGIISNPKQFF